MNERNNEQKNKIKYYYSDLKGFHRAVPILLVALSILIFAGYITSQTGFGHEISGIFMGLFGAGAWAIPILLIVHAVFYAEDLGRERIKSRIIFSVITILTVAIIQFAIQNWNEWKDCSFAPVQCYKDQNCGGFIGSILAFVLIKIFGPVGLVILTVAVAALYVTYFFAGTNSTIGRTMLLILEYIARGLAVVERFVVDLIGKGKDAVNQRKQKQIEERQAELIDDEFFEVDNGMQRMEIKELGIKESKSPDEIEENPTLHSKVYMKSAVHQDTEEKAKAKTQEAAQQTQPKEETARPKYQNHSFDFEIEEDTSEKEKTQRTAPVKTEREIYGLDEKAENVFTNDFDPFDFNEAEVIASRRSSRAPITEKIAPIFGEAVDLDELTEDDVRRIREKEALAKKMAQQKEENERRRLEFEKRKQMIINQYKSQENEIQDPKPENTQRLKTTYSTPTFTDYSSHRAKEDVFAVKEQKNKERQAAQFGQDYQANVNSDENFVTAENTFEVQNMPKMETKVYNEPAKTVAFNVSGDVYRDQPRDNSTVSFSYDKTQKEERTEDVAYAVAQAVAMNNPMYARSENVTNGTYTCKVTVSDDEQFEVPSNDVRDGNRFNYESANEESSFTATDTNENSAFEPEEPTFKAYNPIAEADLGEQRRSDDNTLVAQRTMLSPTPQSYTSVPKMSEDLSDITSTFEAVDEHNTPEEEKYSDSFTWTEGLAMPLDEDDDEDFEDDAIGNFEDVNSEDYKQKEIPLEEQNPDVIKMREQFPFLLEEDEVEEEPTEDEEDTYDDSDIDNFEDGTVNSYDEEFDEDEEDDVPFVPMTKASAERSTAPTPPVPLKEKEEKPKADYSNYKLPSVDMLVSPPNEEYDYSEETQDNANRLISALESFNVTASIKGVDRGPRITRYEVVPARGVKVSSILNLQDDIALALAANSIRMEAPIPGKSAIGVEIPNLTSTNVYLRELIETADFRNNPSKTAICIGKDVAGTPVFSDIAKMPHLLVAGATGMGKSVCMNAFMVSLLYKAKPDEVKFIMIDPKKVEFKRYNGIPHLLVPVVADPKQAAGSLMWAVGEMERRYSLIEAMYVSNIDMYNAKVRDNPSLGEVLPRIIIVIDEFSDLMLQVKDPVEKLVMSLAQKARAAGIHLVIGTQRPAVSVITGTIKANIPSRISCKVASFNDSRTVLESAGAEKLLDKGDMLFSFAGSIKPIRVQGAFVSDDELDKILTYVKEQSGGADYDDNVLTEINKAAQKCSKKSGGSDDDDDGDHDEYAGEGYLNNKQFLDAVDIAVSQGQISTSLLQRRISIGFGKAAKFIDIMEDMGIVAEKNGTKPRQVLISKEEWQEKLARTTYD